MELNKDKKIVFTAISKRSFYFKMQISKFVLEQGCVPINPFMNFDYFLGDTVDKDLVREANNVLAKRTDELWVFGPISDGVLAEIKLCQKAGKPIRYFKLVGNGDIQEAQKEEAELEDEVKEFKHEL